jgi:hypothetical protein
VKSLTLFLSALMMWGYSLSAAADPSCEDVLLTRSPMSAGNAFFRCPSGVCRLRPEVARIP